ncbi:MULTISPECIES: DUF4097 family beta strand repeat-containing protein [Streptomyces]|uniref:DUF4097 family beta strand repeat-containing protein n=1 Tax=Streptomyces TaxID=1883 RepID=UPI002249A15C|nr:DUF4097 family beta strand repeat-containing protein [Streptomyces sp. JHD 1]MCX2969566.1 DUF4097 family beta strand repeat-containing protein [Streptomyces sp. JHD 1]
MSSPSEWWIDAPHQLTLTEPVERLDVRIVGGSVNVVGKDTAGARIEVSDLDGPPLHVTHHAGTLTVAYDDVPWQGFLQLLDRKRWRRSVHLTLAVPATAGVRVGAITAATVVSGTTGEAEVRGITGETTLVGLGGPVHAHSVSGGVAAQALRGALAFHSVSGDLTVIDGGAASLRADSVSGDLTVDVPESGADPTEVSLTTVSGEIAVRLPQAPDTTVEAHTNGGSVSCAFDTLHVGGQWGARRVTGTLGAGRDTLKATTVSGGLALLRRSPGTHTDAPLLVKDA